MAKTGIEVKLVFPTTGPEAETGKKFMAWVHKFHLNGLMKVAFDMNKMELTLDDAGTQRSPMLGDHFIECEPGEHKLEVAMSAGSLDPVQRMMNTRTLLVPVERDQITTVQYRSGGGDVAHVEVIGRRPG